MSARLLEFYYFSFFPTNMKATVACLFLLLVVIGLSQQATYKISNVKVGTQSKSNIVLNSECNVNEDCIKATVINNGKITEIEPTITCNSTHNALGWGVLHYFVQQGKGNSVEFKRALSSLLHLKEHCFAVEERELINEETFRYKVEFRECKEQKKQELTLEGMFKRSLEIVGKEGIISVSETQQFVPVVVKVAEIVQSKNELNNLREVSIFSFAFSYLKKLFRL